MDVIIYHKNYETEDALDNFINMHYSYGLTYLASDLLNEGFSPQEIRIAVQKAMSILNSSALNIRQHFLPIYTQVSHQVIWDCKLSKYGYGLVILNANSTIPIVKEWQLKVLNNYFENDSLL